MQKIRETTAALIKTVGSTRYAKTYAGWLCVTRKNFILTA